MRLCEMGKGRDYNSVRILFLVIALYGTAFFFFFGGAGGRVGGVGYI